jgi:hypothetical protein
VAPAAGGGLPSAAALGISALHSFEGLGPAWLPTVKLSTLVATKLSVRLTAAGLGTSVGRSAFAGVATVDQSVVTVALARRFGNESRLQPFATAGAGIFHLAASGVGAPPDQFRGKSAALWAPSAVVGAGCALALHPRVALVIDAEALVTFPHAIVKVAGTEVARAGRPSLLASASAVGSF